MGSGNWLAGTTMRISGEKGKGGQEPTCQLSSIGMGPNE
jgi:hypothetical protein